jgi:PKD repeat protein
MGGLFGVDGFALAANLWSPAPAQQEYAMNVLAHNPADPDPTSMDWLDWVKFVGKRLSVALSPDPVTKAPNTDINFVLGSAGALPDNLEYLWDFADNQTAVTQVASATHQWTTAGTYTVKVTARVKTTKQPVAKATSAVTVETTFPVWRITSATVTADVMPLNAGEQSAWSNDVNAFRGDTAFWNQIKRGERDGVLVFATKDAPGLVRRGLWLLASPTTDFANIPAMPNPMLSLTSIGSQAQQSIDPALDGKYIENGSVPDGGMITGLGWITTTSFANLPGTYNEVSVSFIPTTAIGTVDITYRAVGGVGTPVVGKTWRTKITFQATRIR